MEKELDSSVIKSTQTSLGKYVKRPPLSEKLLKKPPFRFLHDIITTVLKNTGFFEGLFEQEELVSDNVKDRDSKISFLNKVIAVVGETTGKTLSIKSTKIVAGQEPEKTNELLQCLAHALDKKLSSEAAVKKYKDGLKLPQKEKKAKEPTIPAKKSNDEVKKLSSRSSEKLTKDKKDVNVKKEKEISNSTKTKAKESSIKKEPLQKKPSPSTKTLQTKNISQNENRITNKKEKVSDEDNKESGSGDLETPIIKRNNIEINLNYPAAAEQEVNKDENEPNEELQNNLSSESYTIDDNNVNFLPPQETLKESLAENMNEFSHKAQIETEKKLNSLEKEDSVPKEFNQNKQDDIDNSINAEDKSKVKSINNYSKNRQEKDVFSENISDLKSNSTNNAPNNNIARPPSVRPPSSRPGAPRVREKHDSIINSTENLIVGKVNIITENNPNEEEEDSSFIVDDQTNSTADMQELHLATNQHGHLVQQILDSQKELSQIAGKTEIEWQFGAQKARDAVNQEIEQVKYNIQALSRIANPLGKLLDHVQEDVEVMRQELQQWINTYEEASKELSKEKSKNEDSLFPLRTKLKQLDADITEKHDKINDLKVVIHKNSSRIDKLLASGKVQ